MLRRDARALAGAVFVLAGAAAIAVALAGYLQAPVWQAVHAEEVVSPQSSPAAPSELLPGSPIARLRISRMNLDVAVIEGTRPKDLLKAPGHVTGSALPGEPRNCILAGHRDLHFRRLGSLKAGDRVEFDVGGVSRVYEVAWARIIEPSETSVLRPGDEAVLTLITCYPFRYVGTAPRRYVVRARLVDGAIAGIP